ncbi:uncharacterized protein LOC120945568 isoform X2 [Rana temporaria]|uniref:uncharacterized protein LOC120945568 isoform X2 n=1 Tax=Rana temporaria TaxID=8407 RepID=UPI001AACF91D|nr:uncharacterized protein LOC120945568 isoform X2 [Rana temporaria]
MEIQTVLLKSFLFSCVWSYIDIHGEDRIDPFDMLHYDAASQKMKMSKQREITAVLEQYLKSTLENFEKPGEPTADEDAQYHAEITVSSQTLRDFLKCINKEIDCDPTILEKHLQNIHFRLKTDDDNNSEDTFPMFFDRFLEVAIFLFTIVGFLDLVKDFTTKCFKKIFHREQNLQIQQMPPNVEDLNLSFGVQEVPIAHVNDEGPGQEPNQEQSSGQSPERPQRRPKSNTDGFKNSENDKQQLLKQQKGPKDYISSTSTTAAPKLIDNENEQEMEDLSDSFGETFNNVDSGIEGISGSLSFVVIEEDS